jgi:hypothetical protein
MCSHHPCVRHRVWDEDDDGESDAGEAVGRAVQPERGAEQTDAEDRDAEEPRVGPSRKTRAPPAAAPRAVPRKYVRDAFQDSRRDDCMTTIVVMVAQ